MSIGLGLVSLIILKFVHHLGLVFGYPFLQNLVYGTSTLTIIGLALIYSTAIELAYTLFTDGPDEAINPLILGLAAAILIGISDPKNFSVAGAGAASLFVLVLAALFIISHFFIQENQASKTQEKENTSETIDQSKASDGKRYKHVMSLQLFETFKISLYRQKKKQNTNEQE